MKPPEMPDGPAITPKGTLIEPYVEDLTDNFDAVFVKGFKVGKAYVGDQPSRIYLLEFSALGAEDMPLRVALNQELTELLVGSLIDTVES